MKKRIIEITGVAGVGKSFIIKRLLNQNPATKLDSEIIREYNLNDLCLFLLFFKSQKSFDNLINILKLSIIIDGMGLFDRLNFIRNSIKKIGKYYFLKYEYDEKRIVLVDEGVSHLYQNVISPNSHNSKKVVRIIDRIIFNLNFSWDILVVDAPFETIYERLKRRGHKRVKPNELISFIKKSKEQITRLKRRFPNIIEIENSDRQEVRGGVSYV